jgi:Cu+-exporting ATPase
VAAIGISAVQAQSPAGPGLTAITVPDMHCVMCAKKMARQLQEVAGVAKADANVAGKAMVVTPKPQAVLSPRSMWEAVEKAGYKPSKLEGPTGTFTAKPQS